jgi:hypothetical protein
MLIETVNDGVDISFVISSLVQMICDPYYRTVEGFKALFYKEWLLPMYSFAKKSSLILYGGDDKMKNVLPVMFDAEEAQRRLNHHENLNQNPEYAPTFIFFLDCVHQLY